jgi:hypothetical protein
MIKIMIFHLYETSLNMNDSSIIKYCKEMSIKPTNNNFVKEAPLPPILGGGKFQVEHTWGFSSVFLRRS